MMTGRWTASALMLIFLGGILSSVATSRSGLYNNRRDPGQAMQEHRRAWATMNWGPEFSRLQLHALVDARGGACITEEAQWETVRLDQRLDRLLERHVLVACHVDVRGAWPFDMLGAYRWTTLIEPVTPDRVRLRGTRRQRDTL